MRFLSACAVVALLCCSALSAQDAPKPEFSPVPLTSAQIAVYRAFLADYNKGSKGKHNLADTTDSFQPDKDNFTGCMKDFSRSSKSLKVHNLTQALGEDPNAHLVDGDGYKVKDVGEWMEKGQTLDTAVDSAVSAGLLTLSEVVFDKTRHQAAFHYALSCGRLCGNGGTVVYVLSNGQWRRSKQSCVSWIS